MLRWTSPLFAVLLLIVSFPAPARSQVTRLDRKVVPTSQAVRLSLDADQTSYRGAVRIELQVNERTDRFRFHSEGPAFGQIQLRSEQREYRITVGPELDGIVTARVTPPLEPGDYVLAIDFTNEFDTQTASLYKQTVEGNSYTFTQFEASDAREAFPCWDEPEFKIPWHVTLIVPKDHLAIANTPVERETEFGDQKAVVFHASPPMPAYLVALATGPFESVEIPGLSVPGRIVTVAGKRHLAGSAAARVPVLMKALEDYFGQPYPYKKLDILAVPEYAYGAMENPGAITFADRILLIDPAEASPARLLPVTEILAHEIAHMWFGNLVTIRWWDDLWLKEAFASWMGDKITNQVYAELNTDRAQVAGAHRAMVMDARPSTHAMRQKVGAEENLDQLADDLAYDKGQAVLGMFEQWLGPSTFQAGVSRYLQQHEWKNANAADLWKALGEAAGTDVSASMSTFLDQPGVPLVSCELLADGNVVLRQKRFWNHGREGRETPRWIMPVALRYSDGGTIGSMTVVLTEPTQTFALPTGTRTQWVLPNADARGYYRWHVPAAMLQTIAQQAPQILSPRERAGFVYNLTALLDAGLLRGNDYLAMLAAFARDPEPEVVRAVSDGLDEVRVAFTPPGNEAPFARYVRDALRPALDRIGLDVRPGEREAARELRPRLLRRLADSGSDPDVLAHCARVAKAYLEAPSTVDGSMIDEAIRISAIRGDSVLFSEYRRRFESATTPAERRRFLEALGNFRSHPIMMRALDYALSGPMRPQELLQIPRAAAAIPQYQDEVYLWMTGNYGVITARMPALFAIYLPHFASGCSLRLLEAADAFFSDPRHRPAGTEKELAQLSDSVRDCAALRQREGPAVSAYLEGITGAK